MLKLPDSRWRAAALLLLSLGFVAAGLNHFRATELYMTVMPPWLPAHRALVLISGMFEVLGGLGVLPVRTRRWAGLGLILLMVAVFPANVQMALEPGRFVAPQWTWLLYARLPLQAVMMYWAWWATRADSISVVSGGGRL